jgi:hypothetical protein
VLIHQLGLLFLLTFLLSGNVLAMPETQATLAPPVIDYVAGSSQKVCQLTGERDYEFNTLTSSQTQTRYGLVSADEGYSFEHNGKLFFLFGDTQPTSAFNGKPNLDKDPPRDHGLDDDAIGYVSNIAGISSLDQCVKLDFTTDSIGAYKNPVVLNAQGQPAITLRVDEFPGSGISDGGRMFVIFLTDNYVYPTPGPSKGNLGHSTRSVVGVSDDDGNTWHYLYDFSRPTAPGASDAKFLNTYIAHGQDGYLYVLGTEAGTHFRHSPVFLARKPVGSMNNLNPIQYLQSVNLDGTPFWASTESAASPLFNDSPADCAGQVGVEWNQFVNSWVMLYDCLTNNTPTNPHGIWMRTAAQPWGPWSAPQTVFNLDNGFCKFIHRAVDSKNPTACDNLSTPWPNGEDRSEEQGATYFSYPISRFNTGDASKGISMFYWTMATFNPYTQVIMKTTIQSSREATGTIQAVSSTSKAATSSSVIATKPVEAAAPNNTWLLIAAVVAIVVVAVGAYLLPRKRPTNT